MSPPCEFCIRQSKLSLVLLLIAGVPLVAACILIASFTLRAAQEGHLEAILDKPIIIVHLAAWVGALFFPVCMLIGVKKLLTGRPDLCVVSTGLVFYPETKQALLIPWSSVEHVGVDKVRAEEFFSIRVRDLNQLYRQSGRRPPSFRWVNRLMGFGDFSISMRGTGMTAAALIERVQDMAGNQLKLSKS